MLGRLMECPMCGHSEHLLRCEADVDGVPCPCRDVPVPGLYPRGAES